VSNTPVKNNIKHTTNAINNNIPTANNTFLFFFNPPFIDKDFLGIFIIYG
tara:strand:- start:7646 stop:7795 length:150 start_codon:yes stop_codon:yes gene_type:complete